RRYPLRRVPACAGEPQHRRRRALSASVAAGQAVLAQPLAEADLRAPRGLLARPRRLEHAREILEARFRQEHGAAPAAALALAPPGVTVAIRTERRLAVVEVKRAEPVETDDRVEVVEHRGERVRRPHVEAAREHVAGVQADAEPRP